MKQLTMLLAISLGMSSMLSAQEAKKIIFSNNQKPAAANSKESFASNEFIYGSVDLGGKTVKDYFKLPTTTSPSYLYYVCEVYKGETFIGDNNWNIALLKKADEKNTVLNFDVLPEPAKASTVMSGTPAFDAGKASTPLYMLIARQYFKETGTYNIRFRIYNRTLDAYGNEQPWQKWPTASGSFNFNFNEDDVPALLKNGETAAATAKKKAGY